MKKPKPWKSTMTREWHADYRRANHDRITADRHALKINNPEKYAERLQRSRDWYFKKKIERLREQAGIQRKTA